MNHSRRGEDRGAAARSLLLAVLVCGLLSACEARAPSSGAHSTDEPVRGGSLVVALQGEIDSWNPYTTQESAAADVLELLYPRLVREIGSEDGESKFEPWLARSWEFSDDRLTLTFHLRPEARWSDGTPVTCEDVRFTYRAQLSDALAWPGVFIKERIGGVDCPDPHTVVVGFTEAYADQLLDANDDAIVPATYGEVPFESWMATAWENRIKSCGPFRLHSVEPGQEAVLERDPRWWGAPAPHLDRVILRVYPDSTAAVARLLDGEVDLLSKVPPLKAEEIAARSDLRLVELPSLSYTFLGWNSLDPPAYLEDRRARGCAQEDPPCRDREADIARLQREHRHPILGDDSIRRALALAIDRTDIVEGLWDGHARVGTSPIVSTLWAHDPHSRISFDPGRAASLLERAGWIDADGDGIREREGRKLELRAIVNSESRVRNDVLERVSANLSAIGVRLVPEPLPRREFVARARNKQFDVVLGGWWAGTRIEPQNLLHTRAALDRGNNLVSWSTPESDALMDRAAAAPTREAALPLWMQWQQVFKQAQPLTVIYEERRLLGTNGRVRGPTPSHLNPFESLHLWWVDPEAAGTPR